MASPRTIAATVDGMARGQGCTNGHLAQSRGGTSANLSAPCEVEGTLSVEERATLATYEAQAATWTRAITDQDFWAPEADMFAQKLPSGRILDLGCGSGRDAALLSGRGYDVTGVDVSYALLRQAAAHEPRAQFVHGSMYALPFPENSFDGVWAASSLLHAPRARIGEALAELRRVVRPGGTVFVALKSGHGEEVVETPTIGPRLFSYWTADAFAAEMNEVDLPVDDWYERQAAGASWLCAYASA